MLAFLSKFRKTCEPRSFCVPEDLRVYAVGDIHGRADLLRRLHGLIAGDADVKMKNVVVYLGDYLDRGPYVQETLTELLSGVPRGFRPVYLQGNHEELFLNFLKDPSFLDLWLDLGGQSTLLNYRVHAPGSGFSVKRAKAVRQDLLAAMPGSHLAFLKNLKPYIQVGDYLFVHAGIRPGVSLQKQVNGDLFWIREDFLGSGRDHGVKVVHGHTIQESVQAHPNRLGVDTGAYATGVLTCAVLEADRIRFLSTVSA